MIMRKNITYFKKIGIIVFFLIPIVALFACIDKDGKKDLSPTYPTKTADSTPDFGENQDSENDDNGINFPVFEDGVLAFPGAEGYGKNATGARINENSEVYHVTNLNSGGSGSFADAVNKPYRTIVFDVSGVIDLKGSTIVLKSNQTILGQTAPGDGVVIYGGRISASGANNLIVRYLRIRMGKKGPNGKDALGIANGENMIFDHCSISWGRDENFSINSDGKGIRPKNITIQNSIIAQGLQNHSCGGLIQTGINDGVTIYRNLYIDNKTRNPKVKGLNQFVNNVVYNWGNGTAYNMGGSSVGDSETVIENNYFIVGPCLSYNSSGELQYLSPSKPFTGAGGDGDFRTYFKGNYYDKNKDGILNGFELTKDNWNEYCSGSPIFLETRAELHKPILNKQTAEDAYHWIVKNGGASLPKRDQVDYYLINELSSLGKLGTIISDERNKTQFSIGGPGNFEEIRKNPLEDSDNDGIPDSFEDIWGLDKNDPTDAMKKAKNGYTNLENYVLSLEYPEIYEYELNKE